jgi:hypothetical protein
MTVLIAELLDEILGERSNEEGAAADDALDEVLAARCACL